MMEKQNVPGNNRKAVVHQYVRYNITNCVLVLFDDYFKISSK